MDNNYRAEILRLIDDFDTKAEQVRKKSKDLFAQGKYEECVTIDALAHPYEYCSAVLRQLLPHG